MLSLKESLNAEKVNLDMSQKEDKKLGHVGQIDTNKKNYLKYN